MNSRIHEVTDQTFPTVVDEVDTPVLVDFWAAWCAPCRMIAPVVEALAESKADRLAVVKLNVDDNPLTASRFRIHAIPTLILLQNGREIARHVGDAKPETLSRFVESHLAVA